MRSDWSGPVNIGSDEMIALSDLARIIIDISGKRLRIRHVPGPLGVRGRNSDNELIRRKLRWAPDSALSAGLERTYVWIRDQVEQKRGRQQRAAE
jgi:nucleoside-diphosphate-sugar epimerase